MTNFIETFILTNDLDYQSWSGTNILLNLNSVAIFERLPPHKEGKEPCKVKLISGESFDIAVSYDYVLSVL